MESLCSGVYAPKNMTENIVQQPQTEEALGRDRLARSSMRFTIVTHDEYSFYWQDKKGGTETIYSEPVLFTIEDVQEILAKWHHLRDVIYHDIRIALVDENLKVLKSLTPEDFEVKVTVKLNYWDVVQASAKRIADNVEKQCALAAAIASQSLSPYRK
jgi:FMN phosphatase YigB (HAD superfamily)